MSSDADRLVQLQAQFEAVLEDRITALLTHVKATQEVTARLGAVQAEIRRQEQVRAQLEAEVEPLSQSGVALQSDVEKLTRKVEALKANVRKLQATRTELVGTAKKLQQSTPGER
jgi:predicted RNase H-like nuclease (RuvC/YqgF family)